MGHELVPSNVNEEVELLVPRNDSMASLGESKGGRSVRCRAVRLDSRDLPYAAFIKCDVEAPS
jgi:hypothetical protein